MSERTYSPAWWLPSPHLRTLWGRVARRRARIDARPERWETPDGDFVELHRVDAPEGRPRVIFLHGLEGTIRSHYIPGVLGEARRRGWGADLLIFRSCGSEPNRLPRFYHSGETGDLALVVERVTREHPRSPLGLAGVSLGGNVLLKWLGECGDDLPPQVRAAAAVSVPFDLARGSRHIGRGFARVYQRHFLRSLKRKAREKLERFPDLVSREALDRARTMYDFDDAVTAPIHGFADADDYYTRSSSIRWLGSIRRPTLLLSSVDDPFLPSDVLDEVRRIADDNSSLHVEFVARGGHVGFVEGGAPWRARYYAEWRVADFLATHLETAGAP